MQCSQCQSVDAEHYTYKTKTGEVKPLPKCKACHNAGKYQKKGTGWARLSSDKQDVIRKMLADRRNKFSDIELETGVSAVNLRRWVLKGQIAAEE